MNTTSKDDDNHDDDHVVIVTDAEEDGGCGEEGEEVVLVEEKEETIDESAGDADNNNNNNEQILAAATQKKEEGNAHFANQHFQQASNSYREALEILSNLTSTTSAAASNNNNNNNNNDHDDQQCCHCRELHVSLHSNLAQVAIKLQNYQEAESHCTLVIEDWDDSVAKIWYRRGVAREHLAVEAAAASAALQQGGVAVVMDKLGEALDDLKRSVRILQQQPKSTQLIKTALQALDRVHKRLIKERQQQQQQPQLVATEAAVANDDDAANTSGSSPAPAPFPMMVNGGVVAPGTMMNGTAAASTTTIAPTPTPAAAAAAAVVRPPPSPEQQKEDIMRLLISRSIGIKQKQQQQQQQSQQQSSPGSAAALALTTTATSLPGEALLIIDWNWWCQWCRYVDLFGVSGTGDNNDNNKKDHRVLAFLPGGAIAPPNLQNKNDKDNNNNDDSNSTSTNNSTSSTDSDDDDDMDDPGPIDNSALFMPNGRFHQQWYRRRSKQQQQQRNDAVAAVSSNGGGVQGGPSLRPNLVRGFHYEILPREVYGALSQWYGEITPRIIRRTQQQLYEYNNNNSAATGSATGRSSSESFFEIDLYDSSNDDTTTTATTTMSSSQQQQQQQQQQKQNKQQQQCAACRARCATKRCTRCMAVWYCDRTCQEAHWTNHKQTCSKIAQQRKNNNNAAASSGGVMVPLLEGRVGLNNLGNTCFMNSSLQCLSHATPLTRHFLSNQFLNDLNPDNPLGTGGKLAYAFDQCLKELWWKDQTSTSPTALKRAIALFAPRFAGCLQHDAQEFLAYLLDGLHEDLNRIKKAPYVEMPDFDDKGSATHVNASLAWDCHLRRNDSLILDTFYGQFKSTCVCPCGRVSVSFDTFNHVSLEIPQLQQSTVWLTFLVFGGNGAHAAVRYGMGLRRGCLVADFRQSLSKSFGIPPNHMVICEISESNIVEILRDEKPVSTIGGSDEITVYIVEPYTTSSIHIIASHAIVEEDNTGELVRELFGFPFLTSCDANLTCRQLFDHIWASVRHLVIPLTEEGKLDDDLDPDLEEVYEQLINVSVTDTEGNATPVFPTGENPASRNPQEEEKNEEEIPQPTKTCYLPRDVDEEIITFLGEDCTSRFLFLSLEWTMKMDVPPELLQKNTAPNNSGSSNNKKKKKMKKNNKAAKMIPKTIGILEKRFLALAEHSSYHECVKRKREMDAARGVTLDQCFETFTKPERLDEHNMWYCSSCKDHVRALKTMELWRLPNILMVHLKRFEFRHGYRRDKLSTFVDFPMEGLDMSKHCAQWKDDGSPPEHLYVNDRVPAVYDLFAVVNHYGRMGFGHYTAFARKWDEEELSPDWALFDDSSARSVGNGRGGTGGVVDDVVSPAAYVLFYRRRTFN